MSLSMQTTDSPGNENTAGQSSQLDKTLLSRFVELSQNGKFTRRQQTKMLVRKDACYCYGLLGKVEREGERERKSISVRMGHWRL